MKTISIFLFVVFGTGAVCQVPILVDPQWVNEHKSEANVRLLHIDYLKLNYENEHIPNAIFLWPDWLAPDTPDRTMNVPDIKNATEIIRGLGISNNSHVVVYFVRAEVSLTARIFLTLEHLGLLGRVSLLDGGLEAWKKSGYSTTKEIPIVKSGDFNATITNLLVDQDYVVKNLKSKDAVIVDARATQYFDGEPTSYPRAGHIAGAKNIPYMEMVDKNTIFKPSDQLQNYFTPLIENKEKELVTYCFIGQTASVVYLTARLLGYKVKQYDGSMQEWSYNAALPMEVSEKKTGN
jgi:thiosulfate/3-mercaptopyruvate sulfurtransferase